MKKNQISTEIAKAYLSNFTHSQGFKQSSVEVKDKNGENLQRKTIFLSIQAFV
jgi:hypothetical protein